MVAVDDIGRFAAAVFESPFTYLGSTIEVAGDALTPPQIATALSQASARQISYAEIPLEALRLQNEEAFKAFAFMNRDAGQVDIEALRQTLPGLLDFEGWLARIGAQKLSALLATPKPARN
jgi:uncharacterized protein YbjT (DUF2867 family)